MSTLKQFAKFLRTNHLPALVNKTLDITYSMDIPLMELFKHVPREQMVQQSMKSQEDFLLSIEEDTLYTKMETSLKRWEEDKLEGNIPKEAIQPSDLVLIYAAQQRALMEFIPLFTKESSVAMEVIGELSLYYNKSQKLAFEILFKIRKEAEEALSESEEKFRAVAQSANDAIIIFDLYYTISFWNKGAELMFGYSSEEMIGESLLKLFPENKHVGYEDSMRQFREGLQEVARMDNTPEIQCVRKDGKRIPIEFSFTSFETRKGKYCSVIYHDITDRREASDKLEMNAKELASSNAELEQFAYVASHDLKEPLRMVTNYIQLLERKLNNELDEEGKEYIDFAVEGASRMRRLITDLLDYSRINRFNAAAEEVDLKEILNEVLDNLKELILEKQTKVTVENLPKVYANHLQMVQLFQNLVGNGVKFTKGRNPEIEVGCIEKKGHHQFFVRDNGIGIEKKYGKKIFLMFQRLHSREEYPGTGIGLAICKKIAEKYGGRIWFDSKPGEGTTFYFTLDHAERRTVSDMG